MIAQVISGPGLGEAQPEKLKKSGQGSGQLSPGQINEKSRLIH